MAVEWSPVTKDVIHTAREIIEEHLPELIEASIAFIFRNEAPFSNGKRTLGMTKKVAPEYRAMGFDYDFLIWFGRDAWLGLTEHQRKALIHHELCHCSFDEDEKAKIMPHDFEEFDVIIRLYGFWWPDAERTVSAAQIALPMMELQRSIGKLDAIDPGRMTMLPQRN